MANRASIGIRTPNIKAELTQSWGKSFQGVLYGLDSFRRQALVCRVQWWFLRQFVGRTTHCKLFRLIPPVPVTVRRLPDQKLGE